MSTAGVVKSFNDEKGWGFITSDAVEGDIFLHVKDCQDGRPNAGDEVMFDVEEDVKRGGQLKSLNVTGCTGSADGKGKGKGKGQGKAKSGKIQAVCKSFNDTKGWGFLDYQGTDVFLHVKDCLDGRPQAGDWLSFDMEDDPVRGPGQLKASNVTGCTGAGKGTGKMMAAPVMAAPMMAAPMMMGGCYGGAMMGAYGGAYGGGMGGYGGGFGGARVPAKGGRGAGKGAVRGGSCNGEVKSFNDAKGWGFITFMGQDVFLHVKDCDGRPQVGDWVTFDMEPDAARPGQQKALNVTGCTGAPKQSKGGASFGPAAGGGGCAGGPYGGKGGRKGGR